jgi:uncharacterized membrane protein required for colicin V production
MDKIAYELSNELISVTDKKLGGIYDLVKVFVCVNHNTLLLKISWYEITGKANDWIKSYLVDRCQRWKLKT